MSLDTNDLTLLMCAAELANGSIGLSDPNPRVGCILRDASGAAAGQGFTQRAGDAHAEIMALRAAAAAGVDLRGGTAWVSLEPCAHHGRTPPCCDALIAAGLARVVVALEDPFPQVAGRGIARLRAAGVTVDVAQGGPAVEAVREQNIGYLSRIQRGRPWVRMKLAASLDGRTALPDGASQWITSAEARIDGHRWRRRAGAILTGSGTVHRDDPRLDVREVQTQWQPRRIVLDSMLETPLDARILQPPGEALLVHAGASALRVGAFEARSIPLLALPGPRGKVDLHRLIQWLAESGVNELHVEAGATLNAALLEAGLVDELLVYLAPKLVGPGRGMAALAELGSLEQAMRFEFTEVVRVGDDVRLRARPSRPSNSRRTPDPS